MRQTLTVRIWSLEWRVTVSGGRCAGEYALLTWQSLQRCQLARRGGGVGMGIGWGGMSWGGSVAGWGDLSHA